MKKTPELFIEELQKEQSKLARQKRKVKKMQKNYNNLMKKIKIKQSSGLKESGE